jgi:hypothetical protein
MTSAIKKTKRVAFTWDKDYAKPTVDDLKDQLKKITKRTISSKEIFMLCLGIGYDQQCMRDVPPRKSDAIRFGDGITESDFALYNAIALSVTKNYLTLLDEDAVYDIVEKFAAGGLMILSKEMNQQPDFNYWLKNLLYKRAEATLLN